MTLYTTVHFPSKDGLEITADLYAVAKPKGYILLCHRSHFNRGEYREIAPKLNELGYVCLAIDQRSGMKVLGTTNETYARAKSQGLPTGYLEAKPDIEASLAYAYKHNHYKPVILLGSSYSASLALLLAWEGNPHLEAVIAFSPGEYLKGITLADLVENIKVPTFVLSAPKEINATSALLEKANKTFVTQYKPKGIGAHGARVLWNKTPGHDEYWETLQAYLHTLESK